MSARGRSESPGSFKSSFTSKRSVSQESIYSGDEFLASLTEDQLKGLDQSTSDETGTVELNLTADFYGTSSRYRVNSPPSSPGKRKADEIDHVEEESSDLANKFSKLNGQVSRADSWSTNISTGSFSDNESPPDPYPSNPFHIVAFSSAHQPFFDKQLSWGAQWEIARLATLERIKYDDLDLQALVPLHGKNNADSAPEIEKILCSSALSTQDEEFYRTYFVKESKSQDPWSELDVEEENLKKDPLCGLGCNSLYNDWYGGRIAFTAKVRRAEDGRNYFLQLEKPELSTSTRFARRLGSRRFIRVRIPDELLRERDNNLLTYFKQDFVIHGRIFRSLYSKEHTVFLVELSEKTLDGVTRIAGPSGCSFSYQEFLEWHNPMLFNKQQTLAKWCARMALGLSNSVPGLQVEYENIHEIDDCYSPEGQAMKALGKSPDSKFILTDGTGYCNYAVLSRLRDKFNWDRIPSAIQFRMFGAKGLLILHPTEEMKFDDVFRVWLRPSQRKISYEGVPSLDRAHLILDVLRRSEFRTPARLSTQIIVNLAENNVSHDILQGLMNIGLDEIAASLTTWSGPYALQCLWATISKINGNVFYTRAAREAGGMSRVLGLSSRDWDEENNSQEEGDTQNLNFKSYGTDEISGCPVGLEETAMVLLDSGFEPQSCGLLAKKLREIFKKALTSYIERYKIVVPQSGEAWMIPDPLGVLEPGEIFLKSSNSLFKLEDISRDHLLGPVLITRHPCCVPSDVQKVQAVWRDELARYTDVIVCSSRGPRSLASMLGGGDYDGDTAHVIWNPQIVNAFQNSDTKYADPPSSMDDAFQKDTTTVQGYLQDFENRPINRKMQEVQNFLLSSLRNASLVGQYSSFHDNAVYRFGYMHDEAWRLAYMFCAVLDSSKTGKTIKPSRLEADRRKYNTGAPQWKKSLSEERSNRTPGRDTPPEREVQMQIKFIMDVLKEGGRDQYDAHLGRFEKFLEDAQKKYKSARGDQTPGYYSVDPVLKAPAEKLRSRATELSKIFHSDIALKEIKSLEEHVKKCFGEYTELKRQCVKNEGWSSTHRDKLRRLSLSFAQRPKGIISFSSDDIEQFKASYAYELDCESERERKIRQWAQFPFDMAMRNICLIKAKSLGSFKAVSSKFYPVLEMSFVVNKFQSPETSLGYVYTSTL